MPSCVGVSPEGIVRYWASVGQEAVFMEQSCELQGQECHRLTTLGLDPATPGVETLVLATTTCTVVLITTSQEDAGECMFHYYNFFSRPLMCYAYYKLANVSLQNYNMHSAFTVRRYPIHR